MAALINIGQYLTELAVLLSGSLVTWMVVKYSSWGASAWQRFINTPWMIGPASAFLAFVASWWFLDTDEPSPGIAPGAVVAFVKECEQYDGWEAYYPAAGRMIVGAGLHGENSDDKNVSAKTNDRSPSTDLPVYDGPGDLPDSQLRDPVSANINGVNRIGGSVTHTLTKLETPSHRHATGIHQARSDGRGIGRIDLSENKALLSVKNDTKNDRGTYGTDAQGGNQPHNNMPPYIALYFCKKGAG